MLRIPHRCNKFQNFLYDFYFSLCWAPNIVKSVIHFWLGYLFVPTSDILEVCKPSRTAMFRSIHCPSFETIVLWKIRSDANNCFCLQSEVDSQKFVMYLCEQVLPTLSIITSADENSPTQLEIFKLLAEFCTHCNSITKPETHTAAILEKLIVSNFRLKLILLLVSFTPEDASTLVGKCV